MHPLNLRLKIVAEAVRAFTPQGSMANQVANGIKQGATFLDGLNTPAQRVQAVASLLNEYAYAQSTSEKERIGLTLGNALLLPKKRNTSKTPNICKTLWWLPRRGFSPIKAKVLSLQTNCNSSCMKSKDSCAK